MIGRKKFHPCTISLFGFISTSLDRKAAENFAYEDLNENSNESKFRVLYIFKWAEKYNYYFMDCGAFSHEYEVLLQDGLTFETISVEKEYAGGKK